MTVTFEVKGVTQNSQYVTFLKAVILTNYQTAKNSKEEFLTRVKFLPLHWPRNIRQYKHPPPLHPTYGERKVGYWHIPSLIHQPPL